MMPSTVHANDDDKYAKFAAAKEASDAKCRKPDDKNKPEELKKYSAGLGLINFETVPVYFFLFVCFVFGTAFAFKSVGGVFDTALSERFGALQLEILGLVMVREKIKSRKSVSGVSGMTFIMYTMVYFSRILLALPRDKDGFIGIPGVTAELKDVDLDATLGVCSFLLVLDVLKSVFWTHCKTYQAELDILKAWYLLPACWTLSLLVRPHFSAWSFTYGYCWSSTLYMDVLALMPQVVMMAQSGGKAATPIANFVAATAISRCGDVYYSLFGPASGLSETDPVSFWTAVSVQIVHLLLVADFMYYFCKARAWTSSEKEEIELVKIELVEV
eukprot:gnl/MRDRNA2_/MRDRNA2_95678_c0_seq1.p1 gnl/MRDRNA2_/MRDRNA2_95678_c0~~gnl/MRDRNA2_/MRDRNA2_95678_c0_seq1.p1  ORF type:complete len:330 (+),score=50.52 gnl/MRDRNA2_/MRDRNA2_95678_c0_seq1:86-1075(+)